MTDNKVEILVDGDSEMMKIIVNGELLEEGNFWDFDTKDTIENILDKVGVDLEMGCYEYDW